MSLILPDSRSISSGIRCLSRMRRLPMHVPAHLLYIHSAQSFGPLGSNHSWQGIEAYAVSSLGVQADCLLVAWALGYNAGEDVSSFAISALSHLASSSISSFVRGFRSSSFAHSAARLVSASFWCPPTLPSSPSSHSCTLSPSPGSHFTLGIT